MPHMIARQERDDLTLEELAEITDDRSGWLDGILHNGHDPTAAHRARVRAMNTKRQAEERTGREAIRVTNSATLTQHRQRQQGDAQTQARPLTDWLKASRKLRGLPQDAAGKGRQT